jgi:hypothetical protein
MYVASHSCAVLWCVYHWTCLVVVANNAAGKPTYGDDDVWLGDGNVPYGCCKCTVSMHILAGSLSSLGGWSDVVSTNLSVSCAVGRVWNNYHGRRRLPPQLQHSCEGLLTALTYDAYVAQKQLHFQ